MNLLVEFNDFVLNQAMRASPKIFQDPANQFLAVFVVDLSLLLIFIWGAQTSLRKVADTKKRILLFGVSATALADIFLVPLVLGKESKLDLVGIGLIVFLNALLMGLAALPYFLRAWPASTDSQNENDIVGSELQLARCPGCKEKTISMQSIRRAIQTCRACGRRFRTFLPGTLMTGPGILFLLVLIGIIYLFLQGTLPQIVARNLFFGAIALYLTFIIYGGRLVEVERDEA